jgi:elongation of very long chain fatty acids protein 6
MFANLMEWLNDAEIMNDPYFDITDIDTEKTFNVSLAFPQADLLYPFPFENNFDSGGAWSMWSRKNIHVPFICVVVYLFVVFGLKGWMDKRERFQVRTYWFYWNTMLSIFSWCGALRMVPHIAALTYHQGLFSTYCGNAVLTYGPDGASGLWTGLFIFSKIPELVDTVFIVLGKSKLHFLQWYHHVTVLLYTWHSYATRSGAGVWFIAMNYTVHAVMYMYFALMNVASERKERASAIANEKERKKALADVKRFKGSISTFALPVTLMQISQMFVGITVMALIYRDSELFNGSQKCYVRRSSWFAGLLMYASYFVLFVVFFVNKYCIGGGRVQQHKKKGVKKVTAQISSSTHRMSTRSSKNK